MFIPYLIILPFAIFALAAIIRRGLKPIDDFKNELKNAIPKNSPQLKYMIILKSFYLLLTK